MSHEAVIISPYSPLFESHDLQGLDKTIFAIRTAHSWHVREQLVLEAGKLGGPFFDVGAGDLFSSLVQRVEEDRRPGGSQQRGGPSTVSIPRRSSTTPHQHRSIER